MRSSIVPIAGAVLALATSALAADTYVSDKVHSEVTFRVKHLVISKVSGRFKDFDATVSIDQAKPEASSVEVKVKTASIDTGEPDRDKHLRSADFFDVEKTPEMTFRSTKIVANGKDHFNVTGTLTIHGVSKEITAPVVFGGFVKDPWGNEKAGFEVAFTINRKDFGLVWNKALEAGGYLVGDDVDVSITLELAKKKA